MLGVVDKYGFVNEGKYIAAILPAKNGFLMFQVQRRMNRGFEEIDYGPLPVTSDGVVNAETTYPSGVTSGWKIAAYYSSAGDRVKGLEGIRGEVKDDIFYHSEEDKIFHVVLDIWPRMLKHILFYPANQPQVSFQEQVPNPTSDFGVFYGQIEYLTLPKVHVAFRTHNPTNMNLRTYMKIYYAEYKIKQVEDKDDVIDVLKKGLAKIITLPYINTHETVEKVIKENYTLWPNELLKYAKGGFEPITRKEVEGDLINVWGKTDGSSTTGTFTLQSDAFTNTPDAIAIPKGFKAKIWSLEISGEACDVTVYVSHDGGSSYKEVKTISLSNKGNLTIEKRSRPLVTISGNPYDSGAGTGTLIQFKWSQATAAVSYMNALIEIVRE